MELINTDGIALIGPGSEWFWAALTGMITAITFIAIWNQLRLQRSQAAIERLEARLREWGSERLTRYKLEVNLALHSGVDRADLPEAAADRIGAYWEKVGNLVRGGHLDRKEVWSFGGNNCRFWWELLAPYVMRWRAEESVLYRDWEWLAGAMAELDRRAGVTTVYDAPYLTGGLEHRIESFRAQLRVEESLRTVTIASSGPVAQPAEAAKTSPTPAASAGGATGAALG